MPLSTMYTSSELSISRLSWPVATSIISREPDASLSCTSCGITFSTFALASSTVAGATWPRPPRADQNSSGSEPWSQTRMRALPPRSSFLIASDISSALIFSLRFASEPFHWIRVRPVSRMKTSPALSDDVLTGTVLTRTMRAPLRWSSRVSYTSRCTILKPLATPPFRYCTERKHCMKPSDSLPCTSRLCTGAPPSDSSSSTAL
mmetsp:Transcript_85537/g.170778  ORF Transcript_85537/g.170778 Transcript_85537/m.170778 type:complete len:205 (-) Transcript_85537:163-777(-)